MCLEHRGRVQHTHKSPRNDYIPKIYQVYSLASRIARAIRTLSPASWG